MHARHGLRHRARKVDDDVVSQASRQGMEDIMTFACTDCSRCGKCYDKHSTCAVCGGDINLLEDACPACGEPITDEMRSRAKQAYLTKKKAEHEKSLELAAAAKRKREEQRKSRPVYPWEQE